MSERERDEEQKNAASDPNEAAEETGMEQSESQEPSEEVSRREFIRKSAQVAAFSLFGVMGLDAVVQSVLGRLEEIPAMRSMARTTAEMLHQVGIGTMAFASGGCSCPPGYTNPFKCNDPAHPFQCTPLRPFSCTQQNAFQCNPFNFLCDPTNPAGPGLAFQCVSVFDCEGKYGCEKNDPLGTFYCQAGYLCPNANEYSPAYCGPDPVLCTANQFNTSCQQAPEQCQAPDKFTCGKPWMFRCGESTGRFSCSDGKFTCNGGTLYDFICYTQFNCQGGFKCQANHIFICGGGSLSSDFDCDTGGGFTCAAGGDRCNEYGVGAYDPAGDIGGDPTPGDFVCAGGLGDANFDCKQTFRCQTVDDFICIGADVRKDDLPESATLGMEGMALDYRKASAFAYGSLQRFGIELPRLNWLDWGGFLGAWVLVGFLILLLKWLAGVGR